MLPGEAPAGPPSPNNSEQALTAPSLLPRPKRTSIRSVSSSSPGSPNLTEEHLRYAAPAAEAKAMLPAQSPQGPDDAKLQHDLWQAALAAKAYQAELDALRAVLRTRDASIEQLNKELSEFKTLNSGAEDYIAGLEAQFERQGHITETLDRLEKELGDPTSEGAAAESGADGEKTKPTLTIDTAHLNEPPVSVSRRWSRMLEEELKTAELQSPEEEVADENDVAQRLPDFLQRSKDGRTVVEAKEQEMVELKELLAAEMERRKRSQAALKQAHDELEKVEKEVEALHHGFIDAHSNHREWKGLHDGAADQIQRLTEEISLKEQSLKDLNARLTHADLALTEKDRLIDNLKATHTSELAERTKKAEELQDAVLQKDAEISSLRQQVQHHVSSLSAIEGRALAAEQDRDQHKTEVASTRTALELLFGANIEDMASADVLRRIGDRHAADQSFAKDVEANKLALETENLTLTKRCMKMEADVNSLKAELAGAQKSLEEAIAERDRSHAMAAEHEERVRALDTAHQDRITSAEAALQRAVEAEALFAAARSTHKAEIETLMLKLSENERELSDHSSRAADQVADLERKFQAELNAAIAQGHDAKSSAEEAEVKQREELKRALALIEQLEGDIAELHAKSERDVEDAANKYKTDLDAARLRLTEIQDLASAQEAVLQDRIAALETSLAASNKDIQALTAERAALQNTLREKDVELSHWKGKHDEAQIIHRELTARVIVADQVPHLEADNAYLKARVIELENATADGEEAAKVLADVRHQLELKEGELDALREELLLVKAAGEEHQSTKQRLGELDQEFRERDHHATALMGRLSESEAHHQSALEKLQEAEAQKAAVEAHLAEMKAVLLQTATDLQARNAQVEGLKAEQEVLVAELAELQRLHGECGVDLETHRAEVAILRDKQEAADQAVAELAELRSKYADRGAELEAHKAAILAVKAELAETERRLEDQTSEVDLHKSRAVELEKKQKDADLAIDELAELRSKYDDREADVEAHKAAIFALKAELAETERRLEDQAYEIDLHKTRAIDLGKKQNDVDGILAELAQLREAHEQRAAELDAHKTELVELRAKQEAADRAVTELAELKIIHEQQRSELELHKSRAVGLNQQHSEAAGLLAELGALRESHEQRGAEQDAHKAELVALRAKQEAELAELQNKLGEQGSDLDLHKSRATDLEQKLRGTELILAELAELREAHRRRGEELDAHKSEIAGLKTEVEAAKGSALQQKTERVPSIDEGGLIEMYRAQIAEVVSERNTMQIEIEDLKKTIEAMPTAEAVDELKKTIETLPKPEAVQELKENLAKEVANKEEVEAVVKQLNETIAELRKTEEELRTSLQAATAAAAAAQRPAVQARSRSTLTRTPPRRRDSLGTIPEAMRPEQQLNGMHQGDSQSVLDLVKSSTRNVGTGETAIPSEGERQELLRLIEILSVHITAADQQLEEQNAHVAHLQAELNQHRAEGQGDNAGTNRNSRVNMLESRVEKQLDEIAQMEYEVVKARSQCNAAESRVMELEKTVADFKRRVQELKASKRLRNRKSGPITLTSKEMSDFMPTLMYEDLMHSQNKQPKPLPRPPSSVTQSELGKKGSTESVRQPPLPAAPSSVYRIPANSPPNGELQPFSSTLAIPHVNVSDSNLSNISRHQSVDNLQSRDQSYGARTGALLPPADNLHPNGEPISRVPSDDGRSGRSRFTRSLFRSRSKVGRSVSRDPNGVEPARSTAGAEPVREAAPAAPTQQYRPESAGNGNGLMWHHKNTSAQTLSSPSTASLAASSTHTLSEHRRQSHYDSRPPVTMMPEKVNKKKKSGLLWWTRKPTCKVEFHDSRY
ncbi:uncharacterized protein EV422DRAFT_416470 [Fimicolochytrium jonesii]|uniref:uncharacterized protein n=1 Tax=Fimicolochytrium jonesii TaxID=1396493 RepID=UPI0022FE5049|nr:uncharacterized protein EV422DRAFT_416470 [Fimicolochytrium jonesii]KAI8822082.1 hypothetical protein EV422DRAFT_416470 [Fimicolochytrium jonesii]